MTTIGTRDLERAGLTGDATGEVSGARTEAFRESPTGWSQFDAARRRFLETLAEDSRRRALRTEPLR